MHVPAPDADSADEGKLATRLPGLRVARFPLLDAGIFLPAVPTSLRIRRETANAQKDAPRAWPGGAMTREESPCCLPSMGNRETTPTI